MEMRGPGHFAEIVAVAGQADFADDSRPTIQFGRRGRDKIGQAGGSPGSRRAGTGGDGRRGGPRFDRSPNYHRVFNDLRLDSTPVMPLESPVLFFPLSPPAAGHRSLCTYYERNAVLNINRLELKW